MEFSLPAWLGGLCGTVAAVILYVPAMRFLQRRLRAQSAPKTLGQRAAFEDRLSVLRRIILGAAIAILATFGYWVGKTIGGQWTP